MAPATPTYASVTVGSKWRSNLGGSPFVVVGVDDRFAYIKRADEPKKNLAHSRGAQTMALGEFLDCKRLGA